MQEAEPVVPAGLGSRVYPVPEGSLAWSYQGYGEGSDTETFRVRVGSMSSWEFSGFLAVFLGFPAGFPPGPILKSVFLWLRFCRQKPPFTNGRPG